MQYSNINISKKELHCILSEQVDFKTSHSQMVPEGRRILPVNNQLMPKKSAVLLLLYPGKKGIRLILTRRSSEMKHHAGQISFPGGRCERNELSNPVVTALREANEEIGLQPDIIEIVGRLSEVYVEVSNFSVSPFVGWTNTKPTFSINKNEVDELIDIELSAFLDSSNRSKIQVDTNIGLINAPCYQINGYTIWGATSMMIAELEAKLKQYYSRRAERSSNVDNDREC